MFVKYMGGKLGSINKCNKLEGTAAYGHLLLTPAEGWWPTATWRALRALLSFIYLGALQALLSFRYMGAIWALLSFRYLGALHQ